MGSKLKKLSFLILPGAFAIAVAFSGITGCSEESDPEPQADTIAVVDTATPVTRVSFSNEGDSLKITDHKITTKIMLVDNGDYTTLSTKDTTWSDTVVGGKVPSGELIVMDTTVNEHFEASADGDSLVIRDTIIVTKVFKSENGQVTLISTTPLTVSDTTVGGKVPFIVLTDASIQENDTVTLNAGITYHLKGFVFVEKGAVLNIPEGTVLKGEPGGGLNASALIIARGGKLNAVGTAEKPIIFTSTADDVTVDDDLTLASRGMWGGVLILGCANTSRPAGFGQIEGIDPEDPRGIYGSDADFPLNLEDNSGTIKYVSIRYGGTNIGEGNEINGLTMGAVGSGTTIENVEVFNNDDDGFEWFGGTVNTKYLVSAGNADDSYDWDEGFKGKGQFWVVIQDAVEGDRGGECDGNSSKDYASPNFSNPTLYNMTWVGSGSASARTDNRVITLREATAAKIYNSIFTDFKGQMSFNSDGTLKGSYAIEIDSTQGGAVNSYVHLREGDLDLANNIFYGFGQVSSSAAVITDPVKLVKGPSWVADTIVARGNTFDADPMITKISRGSAELDLTPAAGSPALTGDLKAYSDSWFTSVSYKGALGPNDTWMDWTFVKKIY